MSWWFPPLPLWPVATAALPQVAACSNLQSTVLEMTYLIPHPGWEPYPQQSLKHLFIQGFGRMQRWLTATFAQSHSLMPDLRLEAGCLPNVWANIGSQVVLLNHCDKNKKNIFRGKCSLGQLAVHCVSWGCSNAWMLRSGSWGQKISVCDGDPLL